MKKILRYEFVATQGKDGCYECNDLPVRVRAESSAELDAIAEQKAVIAERMKAQSDVNRVFFDSYQKNFTAESDYLLKESNDLLKKAQENMMEMQKRILDSLKS